MRTAVLELPLSPGDSQRIDHALDRYARGLRELSELEVSFRGATALTRDQWTGEGGVSFDVTASAAAAEIAALHAASVEAHDALAAYASQLSRSHREADSAQSALREALSTYNSVCHHAVQSAVGRLQVFADSPLGVVVSQLAGRLTAWQGPSPDGVRLLPAHGEPTVPPVESVADVLVASGAALSGVINQLALNVSHAAEAALQAVFRSVVAVLQDAAHAVSLAERLLSDAIHRAHHTAVQAWLDANRAAQEAHPRLNDVRERVRRIAWSDRAADTSPVDESWTKEIALSAEVYAGAGGGFQEKLTIEKARHESGRYSVTLNVLLGGAVGLGVLKCLNADLANSGSLADTYEFDTEAEADAFSKDATEAMALIVLGGVAAALGQTRLTALLLAHRRNHADAKVQSDTGVTLHAGLPVGAEGLALAQVDVQAGARVVHDLRTGEWQAGRTVSGSFDLSAASALSMGLPVSGPPGVTATGHLDGEATALYRADSQGRLQSLDITLSGTATGELSTGPGQPWSEPEGHRITTTVRVDLTSERARLEAVGLEVAMQTGNPVAISIAMERLAPFCGEPQVETGQVTEERARVGTPFGGVEARTEHYERDDST